MLTTPRYSGSREMVPAQLFGCVAGHKVAVKELVRPTAPLPGTELKSWPQVLRGEDENPARTASEAANFDERYEGLHAIRVFLLRIQHGESSVVTAWLQGLLERAPWSAPAVPSVAAYVATVPAAPPGSASESSLRLAAHFFQAVGPSGEPHLLALAKRHEAPVRAVALHHLGFVWPMTAAALAALEVGLNDPSVLVRRAAVRGLAPAGAASRPALAGIRRMRADRDASVSLEAVLTLWNIAREGLEAAPELWEHLKTPRDDTNWPAGLSGDLESEADAAFRHAAESTLVEMAQASASHRRLLLSRLREEEGEARFTTARLLAQVGAAAADCVPALRRLFAGEEGFTTRREVALAIFAVAGEAKPLVEAYTADLEARGSATDRTRALHGLIRLAGRARAALPAVRRCLDDEDFSVRSAAKEALAAIQGE